jgi:hypothetical protein
MNDSNTAAQSLAYLLITGGCLLAVFTAFEPQPTGAWYLAGTWLFCGLIPYIVYGSFTTLLDGCSLVTTGVLLLSADLVARAGYGFTAATTNSDPLVPVLLVTVLVAIQPVGVLLGKGLARLPLCRQACHNPGVPG